MSQTCAFSREEAERAGVIFTPVEEGCHGLCAMCSHLGDEFACKQQSSSEDIIGYKILCPDGSTGFAFAVEGFQCKEINQEILAWFTSNLDDVQVGSF